MNKKGIKFNSGWCFATMNGRLAEISFDSKYGVYAHCYVKRGEFNKREQKMIDSDIKKYQFTFRNGYYFDKKQGTKQKVVSMYKVFPEINNKNSVNFSTLDELKRKLKTVV